MKFLYDELPYKYGHDNIIDKEIPKEIINNINPDFELRPYQKEAFQRFFIYNERNFEGKQLLPYHLLYNMATGSGKTLIMAGLILYLYQQGYRNFLFFSTSTNIIEKTKDNFLNNFSKKYQFNQKIIFDNKNIKINQVDSFETSDNENINICFTTIHKLHIDLYAEKENALTFEDFKDYKICLLADEAHHFNTATKGQLELFNNWENTILKLLNQNEYNILLEFTATIDYDHPDIREKYKPKVIFMYELKNFRNDGYSKEVNLLRSELLEEDRILQAIVLNQYKQEVAVKYGINLKPIILFKAKRTIKESMENERKFHNLIDTLSNQQIERLKATSNVKIINQAFIFFEKNNISITDMVNRIKQNFAVEYCLNVNEENIDKISLKQEIREELIKQEHILNSLEDENNPIRAIFAVQKLNEGWDVLNLFDIVRLYKDRDAVKNKPGATTMAEAQLIGRGARYFPFITEDNKNKYTRKYDNIDNELKIIEELHYHTIEDSRYISELKKALIETGIYEDEDNYVEKELKLKKSFKENPFYLSGQVFKNKKIPNDYNYVKSFSDLGVSKKNIVFELSSGFGEETNIFSDKPNISKHKLVEKDISLKEIQPHIIKNALSRKPFFHFSSLKKYFPNVRSMSNFITDSNYLAGLSITFKADKVRMQNISNSDFFYAIIKLLDSIENEIKSNITEYIATDFKPYNIADVFTNKLLKINKNDERAKGQEDFLIDKQWYIFNANYGTTEEKAFVNMFARRYEHIEKDYNNIYLIRNERTIKIYDEKARAFEPDYLLFMKQKKGDNLILQIFIEPKGQQLLDKDKWKEDFLKKIRDENKIVSIQTGKYKITGVPFYNNNSENDFIKTFDKIIK